MKDIFGNKKLNKEHRRREKEDQTSNVEEAIRSKVDRETAHTTNTLHISINILCACFVHLDQIQERERGEKTKNASLAKELLDSSLVRFFALCFGIAPFVWYALCNSPTQSKLQKFKTFFEKKKFHLFYCFLRDAMLINTQTKMKWTNKKTTR